MIIKREELRLGKYSWAPEEVEAARQLGLLTEEEYKLAMSYAKRVPFELSPFQWAEEMGIKISRLRWTLDNLHNKIIQIYQKVFKDGSKAGDMNLGDLLMMTPEDLEKLAKRRTSRRRRREALAAATARRRVIRYDPLDDDILARVEEDTGKALILFKRRQVFNQVKDSGDQ